MRSVMTRHQQRIVRGGTNTPAVKQAAVGTLGKQNLHAQMEAALLEDLKSLGNIQSRERKQELKRTELLPKYLPFVEAVKKIQGNHGIIGQVLVWMFDVKDIPQAVELAAYCREHGVRLPERFKRSLDVFVSDQILEWAERLHENKQCVSPYFDDEFALIETDLIDVPDEVRAKFFRIAGLIALDKSDFARAVDLLDRALRLGALVKTRLAEARKGLEKEKTVDV